MVETRRRRGWTWFSAPETPAPVMPCTEIAAKTTDNVTLSLDRVVGRLVPRRGVVLCLHAMMTDGRYFGARRQGSFVDGLAQFGFDVLVADFRGHGRSVPPIAGPDDWSFDDLVELDMPALVAAACDAASCKPSELIVLGHSLGGLVATAALGTNRIPPLRMLLLASTSVWLTGADGPIARKAVMTAYRGVTALFGKAPIRALRAGTADEAATYVHQLTGWTRSAKWTSLRGLDYGAALETIRTPVVPFVGAGDWMCTPADATKLASRIRTAAPLRVVGTAHGDAFDPDHFQLFTRLEMRPFWTELIQRISR